MELKQALFHIRELETSQIKMHNRVQEVCWRYMNYKIKKHDEICKLKEMIEDLKIDKMIEEEKKPDFSEDIQRTKDTGTGDYNR